MEKKTMGSFIAALRKANGMTQKDLAEQLNVTDKSVSRWERDETSPDLTLIPVIAEMFDITTDELLRGERINLEDKVKSPQRKEKQIKYLLNKIKTDFVKKYVLVLGLLAMAFAINFINIEDYEYFEITRAICSCLLLLTVVLQIIFTISTYNSIDVEEFEAEEIYQFKVHISRTLKIVLFVAQFLGCLSTTPYYAWDGWFMTVFYLGISYYLSFVFNLIIDRIVKKKNIYILSKDDAKKLKIYRVVTITVMVIAITIFIIGYVHAKLNVI